MIYRICGPTEIIKRPHLKTLFFPLSIGSGRESMGSDEVQVEGEVLKPGTFVQFDKTMTLNAQLDCLIVYLPEGRWEEGGRMCLRQLVCLLNHPDFNLGSVTMNYDNEYFRENYVSIKYTVALEHGQHSKTPRDIWITLEPAGIIPRRTWFEAWLLYLDTLHPWIMSMAWNWTASYMPEYVVCTDSDKVG